MKKDQAEDMEIIRIRSMVWTKRETEAIFEITSTFPPSSDIPNWNNPNNTIMLCILSDFHLNALSVFVFNRSNGTVKTSAHEDQRQNLPVETTAQYTPQTNKG